MKCIIVLLMSILGVIVVRCCETPCTKEMQPVCGFDGLNLRVFSNECLMNNEKCRDGNKWEITNLIACVPSAQISHERPVIQTVPSSNDINQCSTICPAVVLPVCGHDGDSYKLFDNGCEMSVGNCLRSGENVYEPVPLEKCSPKLRMLAKRFRRACPTICPAIYQPICGFNGNEHQIFASDCMMGTYSCLRSESWESTTFDLCPTENNIL